MGEKNKTQFIKVIKKTPYLFTKLISTRLTQSCQNSSSRVGIHYKIVTV